MPVKKIIGRLLTCFLCFVACHPSEHVRSQLEQARNLYENEQYGSAKQVLDVLKVQYPKDYTIQKTALHLMREIELKEQERNLLFCDSVLSVLQTKADTIQVPTNLTELRKNMDGWKHEKKKAQKRILYLRSKIG